MGHHSECLGRLIRAARFANGFRSAFEKMQASRSGSRLRLRIVALGVALALLGGVGIRHRARPQALDRDVKDVSWS